MNKNIIQVTILISFLIVYAPVFGYIPIYKTTLKEYADPIKTQTPINASGVDIRGANIGKINLTGGTFSGVHAEKCVSGTNTSKFAACFPTIPTSLVGSQFLSVNLSSSNFSDALMSGVNFTGSNIWKAVFRGTDLRNTSWKNVRVNFTDFTNANLTGATGLETLQDDAPGSTTFCNATMPDGTVCSSGTMWNNKIDCNCPSGSDSGTSSNS